MWMQINQYWTQLAEREQRLLKLLAVFLGAMGFYAVVWSPIQQNHVKALQEMQSAEAQWNWLSEQVAQHPAKAGQNQLLQAQSASQLIAVLQKSLREEGLLGFMESMTPNKRGVWVKFASAPAPELTRWLSLLEKQGLVSEQLQIAPTSVGIVEANVSFEVKG
ncbi:type II secretion system protein GspM [Thiomicrorhabdus cannonii]|uniref:type II secretion system protein GspM n=1 Tax=Thiomicrorhabdus cannonii TaxID=2748011 RepID=UPI0015BCEE54|nr:type II secretion system protein GspM [Thiomicrorhabdus cannonii]